MKLAKGTAPQWTLNEIDQRNRLSMKWVKRTVPPSQWAKRTVPLSHLCPSMIIYTALSVQTPDLRTVRAGLLLRDVLRSSRC